MSNSVFESSQNGHDSYVSMQVNQDTGGLSTRRPERILTNVNDSFGMRPIIPLESEVQIERTVSVPEMDDIMSLAPSVREVSELLGENPQYNRILTSNLILIIVRLFWTLTTIDFRIL